MALKFFMHVVSGEDGASMLCFVDDYDRSFYSKADALSTSWHNLTNSIRVVVLVLAV